MGRVWAGRAGSDYLALVELFNHGLQGADPGFRGGTVLSKIIFPEPLRHSEEIGLVRTSAWPIGPILTALLMYLGGVIKGGATKPCAQSLLFQGTKVS